MASARNETTPLPSDGQASEQPATPTLHCVLAPSLNFASHQAAVPLVRELRVLYPAGTRSYEGLRIELTCEPAVILPQTWHVSRVRPGEEVAVSSRDVRLDGGMLDRLTDRMRADVSLRLFEGDTLLDQQQTHIIALARNEWGGNSMPELLAAFVQPNDPAIARLLTEASETMLQAGRPNKLDGYQSRTRERPWEIAAALWAAASRRRLIYAEPPASFEQAGQKVRSPSDIAEHRLATCLDTAVMFAAALEQAGLNAVLCLVKGHALVGVWLTESTLPDLITDDASLLRRYVGLEELVLFETTAVTATPPARFAQAIALGGNHIREEVEHDFVYALDLKQARGRGILPLPSLLEPYRTAADADVPAPEFALEAPPPMRPIDEAPAPAPVLADGRVEHWKRKLLDLTKRNRLLNLKPSKTAIKLVCPDIALVEDKLADDEKLAVVPVERLTGAEHGRDGAVFEQQRQADYTTEFARQALERNQLVADLPKADLQAGLVELYRKAATDLREGGANTLFLAMGSLRWRPLDVADGKHYRAPILLVPVTLERASAATTPKLRRHPDDTVVNMTLLEMLRSDFDISIPELMGPLPTDESGINVAAILRAVRKAVGDARGWSIEDDVVLSTFSFAKYLMWKDLCDRTDALKQSRFVAHMIDAPRERYARNATVLAPQEIDARIDPKDLFAPLQADSSQVAAIHASGTDGDLVLEGPPGTGKSQTIANIIAHNMALGRRVLFVAEKMTALSVVHDRLERVGLGDFCLELHSNKATRRAVVDQLDRAWRKREARSSTEWEAEATRLKALRERLNGLVHALHQPAPSGISARGAIAEACASPFDPSFRLDWPPALTADRVTSPDVLATLTETATTLGEAFAEVTPEDKDAFAPIGQREWSFQWVATVSDAARGLQEAWRAVESLTDQLARLLALGDQEQTPARLQALGEAARALLQTPDPRATAFLERAGDQLAGRVEEATAALDRYDRAFKSLPIRVSHDTVAAVDHEGIGREWELASNSFLLFRFFRQRAVRRRAAALWRVPAVADVAASARALARLKTDLSAMQKLGRQLPESVGWQGIDTDGPALRQLAFTGRTLRSAAARLASASVDADLIRSAMAQVLRDGPDRLAPDAPDGALLTRFAAAQTRFAEAVADFGRLVELNDPSSTTCRELVALGARVLERSSRLNAWCRWQKVRATADASGLAALTAALESGIIRAPDAAAAFRTAYCRWLAPLLIDARPELRGFSATEHERLISQFRALDEALSRTAAAEIRARLSQDVPTRDDATQLPGYGLLSREVQAKRSSRSVRNILAGMGPVLGALTPCLMMSPMSVAQFIPADAAPFDLVIFDEASQITTWDAIGAIARGRNVIIVGDPKQMPPTNFFNRSADDDEAAEREEEDAVADLESILDEALAAQVKHHRLTGHYRSRHESLIAFSNHAYYGGDLVTYPAAETRSSAVSLVRAGGSYQKGKDRTNPTEAKAVVAEVSRRLRDPATSHQSIGIVTMNAEQQRLIRNLLDEERRRYPEIERAFKGTDGEEEDMVYNLETVQGHERDVIIVSVGYGPAEPGGRAMSMNFGPLNRSGGERRLNVAITRATEETIVFASFGPEMIDLTRTKARAVEDLKHYLEFAERGPSALRQATRSGLGPDRFDSPFEEAVARGLRAKGWDVRTQVGVSRFYVDLGIVHPDAPGRFLAGVECDGATYHGSATARDRDRIRHNVLSSLGWTLLRLWSTDYFLDPASSLERLDAKLRSLLEASRSVGATQPEAPLPDPSSEVTDETTDRPVARSAADGDAGGPGRSGDSPASGTASDAFYQDEHLPALRGHCTSLIDSIGPVQMDYLAERIARAYGLARTGKVIRDRVRSAVGNARPVTLESTGAEIVWPADTPPTDVMRYRGPSVGGLPRPWDVTPEPERIGLAIDIVRAHGVKNGVDFLAAAIGLSRLRESRRQELEALLQHAASLM